MRQADTRPPELDILGIFPSWDPGPVGGVQRSGREAWEAILSRVDARRARTLCYEPQSSKTKAALRAWTTGAPAKVVLVWHVDLLKLLPFLNLARSRVVLFLHGVEAWRKHDPVTQVLLRKVDLALTNTDHTWAEFVRRNGSLARMPHRTVHLGLGASLGAVAPCPSAIPAALMISRLDAQQDYKGHRHMIEAWPLVRERTPDAQLWIVGGGDLRPQLETLVRERALGEAVRFYGPVSDVEKDQLLKDSRCFAMPSHGDGFGLVYLEAMRMGRPCLVSTVDAGREVVNPPEAGLAVDRDQSTLVADAVHRLLGGGPAWEAWAARARARYDARFTGDHFRQRLLDALFEPEPAHT